MPRMRAARQTREKSSDERQSAHRWDLTGVNAARTLPVLNNAHLIPAPGVAGGQMESEEEGCALRARL